MSTATTERAVDDATGEPTGQRKTLRLILLLIVPLILTVTGLYFYYTGGRYVSTENAYVRAHIVAVSTDVDGRVITVSVADNTRVTRGTELFRLDPRPFELRVKEAEAEMQVVRAKLESQRAEHREAMASISQARQQADYLKRQLERQDTLIENGVVSAEERDAAQHDMEIAQQRVTLLEQRARQTLANLGGDSTLDAEQTPVYQHAKSRLDLALAQQQKTVVYAAADGVVSNVKLQAGEYVNQGQAVFALIDTSDLWVEANLKETQLTHLREGQVATLSVDAYPDVTWDAVVSTIAPATGAEFSLLPPQNATGNWVKVVQRVPVKLRLQQNQQAPPLRAGMTVTATIDTGRSRGAPAPLRRASDHQLPPIVNTRNTAPQPVSPLPTTLGGFLLPAPQEIAVVQPPATVAAPSTNSASATNTVNHSRKLKTTVESARTDRPRGNQWLLTQDMNHYTVQVSRSGNTRFLRKFANFLPSDEPVLRYRYRQLHNGSPEYGLASGIYSSREHAKRALQQLPQMARKYGPWVRRLGDLRSEISTDG